MMRERLDRDDSMRIAATFHSIKLTVKAPLLRMESHAVRFNGKDIISICWPIWSEALVSSGRASR